MTIQKFDHKATRGLVCGMSGTGKSTLLEKELRRQRAWLKLIYDHQGEYASKFSAESCSSLDELVERICKGGGLVIYDPQPEFAGKKIEGRKETGLTLGFCMFCEFIFAACQNLNGRKILFCDEVPTVTDNGSPPMELLTIMECGRRYQLDSLFGAQAPNRMHNGVRNQLTKVFAFRSSDENAIKYLEENGFDAEKIRNLADHHYLWRDLRTGEAGEGCEKI